MYLLGTREQHLMVFSPIAKSRFLLLFVSGTYSSSLSFVITHPPFSQEAGIGLGLVGIIRYDSFLDGGDVVLPFPEKPSLHNIIACILGRYRKQRIRLSENKMEGKSIRLHRNGLVFP